MPKFYCDYCDVFLAHDSPNVRKLHNSGWKHKMNVKAYYAQFISDPYQIMMDQKAQPFNPNALQHQQPPSTMPQHPIPVVKPPTATNLVPPFVPPPNGMMIPPPNMPNMPPNMVPPPFATPNGMLPFPFPPFHGGVPPNMPNMPPNMVPPHFMMPPNQMNQGK